MTFQAMAQIFLLGFLGYMLVKRKFLDAKGLEVLSGVVIGVALPAFNFSQIITHFEPEKFANWWLFPLLGIVIVFGGILLASLVLLFRPGMKARRTFRALVGFQNSGYMPLMILSAFPQTPEVTGLSIYVILSLIGFDLLLWSLGVWLMTGADGKSFDARKLLNPPMLATLIAVLLMFLGWGAKIPVTVLSPVRMLGNCLLPLVMLVLGGNFALTNLKNVQFKDVACVLFAKLFVYPAVMIGCVKALGVSYLIGFFLVMEAAVPCANSLSVIARYYRTSHQDLVNQSLFLTNVLSILTIPVFLMIYAKLI